MAKVSENFKNLIQITKSKRRGVKNKNEIEIENPKTKTKTREITKRRDTKMIFLRAEFRMIAFSSLAREFGEHETRNANLWPAADRLPLTMIINNSGPAPEKSIKTLTNTQSYGQKKTQSLGQWKW